MATGMLKSNFNSLFLEVKMHCLRTRKSFLRASFHSRQNSSRNYFKSNVFDTTEQNSIDIYKAKDIDEIVEFLNKPIPCCRYCLPNKEEQIQWGVSKKDISEWI